jgi:hypothetical protein
MKKTLLAAALVGLTAASAAGIAKAQYVDLSTGLGSSGNIQHKGGSLDANWTVTGAVNPLNPPNAYVVAPGDADWYGGCGSACAPPWVLNGPYSSWIAANPFDTTGNGLMTFTRTFNVTTPSTATIIGGAWAMDDYGTLSLNGHLLSALTAGNPYHHLHAFSTAASDFVAGLNTLTIKMTYTDFFDEGARLRGWLVYSASAGPEAALVGAGSAVPEASTWAMLVVGFAGLGLAAARSRRAFATMAR